MQRRDRKIIIIIACSFNFDSIYEAQTSPSGNITISNTHTVANVS